MVNRQEQARLNGDRWFGSVTTQTLTRPSSDVVSRQLIHEEARNYWITVAGSASGTARVLTPLDVRAFCLGGPYFTIWNESGSNGNLLIVNVSSTIATVAAGKSVQLYLTDNSTAAGVWKALAGAGSSNGITTGARTFLS